MNIMIVDMIKGFTTVGPLASSRVAALLPQQVKFLENVPQDSFVVLPCDSHGYEDAEFKRMPVHCLAGSEESQICPEIMEVIHRRKLAFRTIPKSTHSAFFRTSLDSLLLESRVPKEKPWVVFGCVTDICITANVIELDYRGYDVIVVRDLVDTYEITAEFAKQVGKPEIQHDPERFNDLFFSHYLPGVWGAKIWTAEETLRRYAEIAKPTE